MKSSRDTTPPRFSTPLTEGRPNLLVEAKNVASMLGFRQLSPWQEDFLALATEYEEGNPQDGIVPWWRNLILTIPRQCGKSECICSILYVLRWLNYYRQDEPPKMIYTTFALEACYDQWETKIGARIKNSKWGKSKKAQFSRDPKQTHFRLGDKPADAARNGRVRVLSNSSQSGRGGSEDFVVLDEAREFGDDSSREKTLVPLLNQRPAPQMIITSTMGTESSTYFNKKVHSGREIVRAQTAGDWPKSRLAYCEYGIGDVEPDSYDAGDPSVWLASHPMLGWGYWTAERMEEMFDLARAEDDVQRFQQEYLNQMFEANEEPAVPWEMLEAVEVKQVTGEMLGGRQVLALHSDPGSRFLAAVLAGNDCLRVARPVEENGEILRVPVERVDDWLAGYLADRPEVKDVVFREGTDLETALSKFKRKGVKVSAMKFAEWKPGCQSLKRAMVKEQVQVEYSQYLRWSVAACEVVESVYSDKAAWYWVKRKDAQGYADELIALVLAWRRWEQLRDKQPAGVLDLSALAGKAEGEDGEAATMSEADKERLGQWQRIYSQS